MEYYERKSLKRFRLRSQTPTLRNEEAFSLMEGNNNNDKVETLPILHKTS